jgi:hypothetical protein
VESTEGGERRQGWSRAQREEREDKDGGELDGAGEEFDGDGSAVSMKSGRK